MTVPLQPPLCPYCGKRMKAEKVVDFWRVFCHPVKEHWHGVFWADTRVAAIKAASRRPRVTRIHTYPGPVIAPRTKKEKK